MLAYIPYMDPMGDMANMMIRHESSAKAWLLYSHGHTISACESSMEIGVHLPSCTHMYD